MTKEELLKKIDFEKSWLYDCGIFGSDVDIAFHAIKNKVIEALEQDPCKDAVNRQAVIDILDDMTKDYAKSNDFEKVNGVAWVKVQKLPSVNPQKIGHWYNPLSESGYFCTNCESNSDFMYPYCPHCGARMGGAE